MHSTDKNDQLQSIGPAIQPESYDDEVTDADIEALRNYVAKHFGEIGDGEIASGPAW